MIIKFYKDSSGFLWACVSLTKNYSHYFLRSLDLAQRKLAMYKNLTQLVFGG